MDAGGDFFGGDACDFPRFNLGNTPVTGVTLSLGKHEVAFQHAKYGRLVYSVSATLAGPVHLNATFKK